MISKVFEIIVGSPCDLGMYPDVRVKLRNEKNDGGNYEQCRN